MKISRLCWSLLLALAAAPMLGSASAETLPETPAPGSQAESTTVLSLEALQRALAMKEAEASALQEQLAAASDDLIRDELRLRLHELRSDIDEQRLQFDGFAADVDLAPFSPRKDGKFDWQEQVGKLLEPILAEFESATAESRIIGQLRAQLSEVGKRRDLAARAVVNLQSLLAKPSSPELRARLENRLDAWQRISRQAENEYSALDLQLNNRLAARESVLDQTTNYAKTFFKTRGLNLLMGFAAFFAVFFGFRLAEAILRKWRRKGARRNFSSRLTALLFHVFSGLGGLAAAMIVFNAAGDWFLLGVVIIFLFGVGWASINTLPQQVETIKLMLNVGAVREGEWLLYDGTPYRVDSLGFSAKLCNPALDGGTRILPVKFLVGMSSRPVALDESWFPCRKGDWVSLADGRMGSIVSQTPFSVSMALPGGEVAAYPVPSFLSLHPANWSDRFRIQTSFGIDYRHQSDATSTIPGAMERKIHAELPKVVGPGNLLDARVLFSRANASSIDFDVFADLKGSVAPLSGFLPGHLQRILVDACNENGWTIPFPQLSVHCSTLSAHCGNRAPSIDATGEPQP